MLPLYSRRLCLWLPGGLLVGCLLGYPFGLGYAESGSGPQVRIMAPKEAESVSGTCTIQVEASSLEGIAQVILSRDGRFLETADTTPYEIPWDTRSEADGPHTLLARARSTDGRWGSSIPIQVIVDNTKPTIQLIHPSSHTMVTGKIELKGEASDNIGIAHVRFFVGSVMVGSVSSPPYSLVWDPSETPNGLHVVKAMAVDKAGNSATSEAVEIKVVNANSPPILTPIGPKTIKEGKRLIFTVSAVDPNGARDPLTYRAAPLPSWATFNPTTGEFSGVPDFTIATLTQPEVTTKVRFEACDPEPLCASEEMTLTILNSHRPPTLKPMENRTLHEGEPLNLTLPPANNPDNEPLVYSAKHLPPWVKFNPSSLTLSGTPDFKIASTADPQTVYRGVSVEVCDPEPLCDTRSFTITVLNTNRPPSLDPIGEQQVDEGRLLEWTAHASDPDGDRVSLRADPLPEGAVFADQGDGSGIFRWPTRTDQGGRTLVTFTASDGELKDTKAVTITLREVSLAISGVIQNPRTLPIIGVTVSIETGGKVVRQVTTDAQGFYLVDDLSPGNYLVKPISVLEESNFSSQGRSPQGQHFNPLSRSVNLEQTDQRGVDFTALPVY